MWAPCTGAPAPTDFFCGFPGCSPRHRAGNNPAKPRQHKQVVHRLYNPPRPRFRSRLRPSHLAPAPAVAYNQPGPGCSRIHPAKCVFQCGFCCWYGTLKSQHAGLLANHAETIHGPARYIATAPNGGHTTVFASCPTTPATFQRLGCVVSVLSRCLPAPVTRCDNNKTGRGTIPGVALVLCCAHSIRPV